MGQLAIAACDEELRLVKAGSRVSRRRLKRRLDAVLSALGGNDENGHKGIMSLRARSRSTVPRRVAEEHQGTERSAR